MRTLTREQARRVALSRQQLTGRPPRATPASIVETIRRLGFVQWDPVPIVAPSHHLALGARLDGFRPDQLERLLWRERKIFEHWMPIASLVLTEDYPLYASLMRRYPASMGRSWGIQGVRAAEFLRRHAALRRRILRILRTGPKTIGQFRDHADSRRAPIDWNPSSDVSEMLFHLGMRGEAMVVGHDGAQNLWGLPNDFLPDWTPRTELSVEQFERAAAERSLRALGVATPRDIHFYFVRGRYQGLDRILAGLEREGTIHRVAIEGIAKGPAHYLHDRDLPLLDDPPAEAGEPRTALLPPFDTLLGSPLRLQRLFDFRYVREQFLPKEKRQFGTYVLPIVHGDRLIGRVDPLTDREHRTLRVLSVHAEPDAPRGPEVGRSIRDAVERLAASVGVDRVAWPDRLPAGWDAARR